MFVPPVDDDYEIRLSGATPRPDILYVTPACGAAIGCIGNTGPGAGDQVLTLTLTSGTSYFIYVDGGIVSSSGPYSLSIQTAP